MVRVVVKKVDKNGNYSNFRSRDEIAEATEQAVRTFKRKVNRDGVLLECRKREYYVKPGIKKRLKHENALKAKRKAQKKKDY